VKLFTFEWAGQFSTVLGVEKINGLLCQLGRDTSFNQGG
jgi:hypothetical protein